MTEAEWLAAREPLVLLAEIAAGASRRKLLLFWCECCRPLLGTVPTLASELAERFAEERYRKFFPAELGRALEDHEFDTYRAIKSLGPRTGTMVGMMVNRPISVNRSATTRLGRGTWVSERKR
jgi:hypothetical protein